MTDDRTPRRLMVLTVLGIVLLVAVCDIIFVILLGGFR